MTSFLELLPGYKKSTLTFLYATWSSSWKWRETSRTFFAHGDPLSDWTIGRCGLGIIRALQVAVGNESASALLIAAGVLRWTLTTNIAFRPHRIDAAYCYRCLCVLRTGLRCKNAWTSSMQVWRADSPEPKQPCRFAPRHLAKPVKQFVLGVDAMRSITVATCSWVPWRRQWTVVHK